MVQEAQAYLYDGVGQLDELGVGLHVFGGGHGHELDGVLVAELGTRTGSEVSEKPVKT